MESTTAKLSSRLQYAIYGAAFGFVFPIVAMVIRYIQSKEVFSLDSFVRIQAADPLLWIIDLAPVILGFFASLAGIKQDELKRKHSTLVAEKDDMDVNLNDELEMNRQERTQLLKRLGNSETKVKYLDTLSFPVYVINPSQEIIYINLAGAKISGKSVDGCIGQKCYDTIENKECVDGNCAPSKALKTGDEFVERTILKVNNLNMPVANIGTPIRDENGKIIGAMGQIVDLSELNLVINEVSRVALTMKEGDLSIRANQVSTEEGYLRLLTSFNDVINTILQPIKESAKVINEMAQGDLSKRVLGEYVGDHAIIKKSLNHSLDSLNQLFNSVISVVNRVSQHASQVSETSTKLANSATDQARSLDTLVGSMESIKEQARDNSEHSISAEKGIQSAYSSAEQGSNQMSEMLSAMNELHSDSSQIGKIIKVIDEIAFQTNLLALNASVEAARAGVHGKGFAVVADEVRDLAQRSAQAAKETEGLIKNTVNKIGNGTEIADKTASYLNTIVERISEVREVVDQINVSSKSQVNSIDGIAMELNNLNNETRQNAQDASNEAIATHELSNEANTVHRMLSRFSLSK